MNNTIPGTVCCLLCRGLVIYKDGDKTRFRSHMNNEHGAFFDLDYLLASCMMETEQKETLSSTVTMASLLPSYGQGEEELSGQFQEQETLGEAAEVGGIEAEDQGVSEGHQQLVTGVKRERIEDQESQEIEQTSEELGSHDDNASTLASTSNSKKSKVSKPRGRKPKGEKAERKPTKRVKKEVESPVKATLPEPEPHDDYTDISSNQEIVNDDQQQTQEDVSMSEETFEDPSQLYYSMNSTYEEGNSSTSTMEPYHDLEPMSSSETDQKLVPSQSEEADHADTSPTENHDEVFDEKTEGKTESGVRYVCEFEGCNKSYTLKANRGTHQKKAHGLLGSRAAKKQRMSVSAAEEAPSAMDHNDPVESQPNAESLTDPPPDYASFTESSEDAAPAADEFNNPEPFADNGNEEIGPISSFLTDSSLGFDVPDHDVFQTQESSTNEREEGLNQSEPLQQAQTEASNAPEVVKEAEVDVSSSKYFQKNPKMMQTAREKSCLLFTEVPDNLPTGWKFRSVEVNNKVTGEKSMSRHYLSPERKVLKTGLAVIEYLRLKGDLDYDALVITAQNLNVPDQKFKSLFNNNQ